MSSMTPCVFAFVSHCMEMTLLIYTVYLRADPAKCYERLKVRNRTEETGIPMVGSKLINNKDIRLQLQLCCIMQGNRL